SDRTLAGTVTSTAWKVELHSHSEQRHSTGPEIQPYWRSLRCAIKAAVLLPQVAEHGGRMRPGSGCHWRALEARSMHLVQSCVKRRPNIWPRINADER